MTPMEYLGQPIRYLQTEVLVFHIESDLRVPGNLIFSDGHSLKTTDINNTELIAGSANERGHTVGPAVDARYQSITGFVQLDTDCVIAINWGYSCLLMIDRVNSTSTQFSGVCGDPGFSDGTEEARMRNPVSITRNIHYPSKIIVADTGNNALRMLDVVTKNMSTLYFDPVLLVAPRCLIFDRSDNHTLYLTGSYSAIYKFNLFTKAMQILAGGVNEHGLVDGPLKQSKLSFPRELAQITDHIFVVATHGNDAVRLFDTQRKDMWTYCVGEKLINEGHTGDAKCSVNSPRSAFVVDDMLLIGGEYGIVKIPVMVPPNLEKLECNSTLKHILSGNESVALINIDPVSMVLLPLGDYVYLRGDNCYVNIHIITNGKTAVIASGQHLCSQKLSLSENLDGDERRYVRLALGKLLEYGAGASALYIDADESCSFNISTTPDTLEKISGNSTCPGNITKVASVQSRTASIQIDVDAAEISQQIELPIGIHPYSLSFSGGINCPLSINVIEYRTFISFRFIDPLVKRRVYVVAHYTVNCTHVEVPVNKQIISETVELYKSQISEICHSVGCTEANGTEVVVLCSNEKLTIQWPTDLVYGGEVTDFPSDVHSMMRERLQNKGSAFSLTVVGHVPLVMYPTMTEDGSAASIILVSYCDSPDMVYKSALDLCVNRLP